VKSAIGDAGEDAFVAWSEQSRKHDDAVARRKYRSLKGDGNPLGLFFMARDHGYTFDHIFNLTAIIESGMAKRAASPARQVEDEDWEMPDPTPSDAPPPEDDQPEQSVLATPITHHGRAPLPEPVGLLKDIKDHILASSMYPQPELALAAALVVVGTAMGRRYTFGKKLRANLYALCIAPSGSGKGHVLDQVEQMLVEAKLENCLGGKEPASGAAVNSRLVDHPVTVYAIDEIGMLLTAIMDRRAPPHVKDVVKTLTELYTKSAGRYAEKDRADRSKAAPRTIQHPHLTVFGVTAETHVWGSINKEAVSDGSLARFMVFESREDYPAPVRHPKDSDIPLGITNALRTVYDRGGDPNAGNLAGVSPESPPNLRMVNASPAATEMFWEATLWEHKNRKRHKASGLSSIYGRFVEQARKLSFIHAIGRDPYRATVEEIDAQWGLEVSAALIEHLVSRINENVAENDQDRTVKRVLQIVVAAGSKGIAVRDLTRKTQWLKMRERREVIDALVAAQQVAEGPEALEPGKVRRGPPRMMVRAI
jgi:hypothetical protein